MARGASLCSSSRADSTSRRTIFNELPRSPSPSQERCKGAPSAIPPAGKHTESDNNNGGGIDSASHNTAERTVSSKALPPGSLKASSSRRREFGDRFTPDASYVDVDTRVSRESYHAARMAAGAVITAVS